MKTSKTYRLSVDTLSDLAILVDRWSCTATDAVERAIRYACEQCDGNTQGNTRNTDSNTDSNTESNTYDAAMIAALLAQLDRKDEQIAGLTDALRAAQALHGADAMPRRIEGPSEPLEVVSGASEPVREEAAPRRSLIELIFGKRRR